MDVRKGKGLLQAKTTSTFVQALLRLVQGYYGCDAPVSRRKGKVSGTQELPCPPQALIRTRLTVVFDQWFSYFTGIQTGHPDKMQILVQQV